MKMQNDNASAADRTSSGYWEQPHRLRTLSGYDVKPFYSAEDAPTDERTPPGEYPYVRGLHASGYRGRLWTRREIAGFGDAADTNARFRFLLENGANGLNCHFDLPTHLTLDPDHPLADGEIGGAGPSICRLEDMRRLMAGIRADEVSMSLISSTMASIVLLSMYEMVAAENGSRPEDLRGTIQNDPLHARYCGYSASCPVDAGLKVAADVMEHCYRNLPAFHTNNVNMYDLREHGISSAQELAFGFGLALTYVDAVLKRGATIDEATKRIAFYCSLNSDFLEEIAKLRAARLVWAKLMVVRYGAAPDSKSAQFRIGSQTAGSTIVPQQPLNNIVRIAYQALSGALAGVSSIHCCGYDEAIGLPSEPAHKIAVRTQQILAYETGVTAVADPLGGSYYIEALTDQIAQDCLELLDTVLARGGMLECVRDGWLEDQLAIASLEQVQAVESGEQRVVGVNWAVEPRETETPGGLHTFSMEVNDRRIKEIKEFKEGRDAPATAEALRKILQAGRRDPDENLVPFVQTAIRADATLAEIVGTIRIAFGLHYDPAGIIEHPFEVMA